MVAYEGANAKLDQVDLDDLTNQNKFELADIADVITDN